MFLSIEFNQNQCAAILPDVWRVEYVWNILKEKLRGCANNNKEQSKNQSGKR